MREGEDDGGVASEAVQTQVEQDAANREEDVGRASGMFLARVGRDYHYGDNLLRAARFNRRRTKKGEPLYRPLRIFMSEPVRNGYTGNAVVLTVPYEPLEKGPKGSVLHVMCSDRPDSGAVGVDLEENQILITQGYTPSASSPEFRQQMVYAVCSDVIATFAVALGRELSWGFDGERLIIRPHFTEERNAYYDGHAGELRFGYFMADPNAGHGTLPSSTIYTCLSRDIIAHEMTHALVAGLRAHFDEPTNPDVLALHEALADLVAIFQHFAHSASVEEAIIRGDGEIGRDKTIFALAEQFGHATGMNGPARIAIDQFQDEYEYGDALEPHKRGSILVSAIVEAFSRVFDRRAEAIQTIYAQSTWTGGPRHPSYVKLLADRAAKTAEQMLSLCIRAIDYCPPVDVTFGDYLRAMITADQELIFDDRYKFRQELIAAFSRRRIFSEDVPDISEESLRWNSPKRPIERVHALSLATLRLQQDPGSSPAADEIMRQAAALADAVFNPDNIDEFGLKTGPGFARPTIDSVRVIRRVGPDRQVQFGVVAEVTQSGRIRLDGSEVDVIGGATVILNGAGEIEFVIRKRIDSEHRARRTAKFLETCVGAEQRTFKVDKGSFWGSVHRRYLWRADRHA
ncbi:MAG: hypothetical protein WBO09_11175 [Methylocystis silviterrae]|uniref:hypothetical protein n=1 Tax=Methylocystis silviterrae TaxID=2743612 RepID=UPI003C775645